MSTARPKLAAAEREVTGKAVRRLRQSGKLPAVLFGHGIPSRSISLDAHQFELLRKHIVPTTLIDVSVDGAPPKPAHVHGVQVNPLTRHPIHVDLFLVRMEEEMNAEVAVVLRGHSDAVDKLGGTLFHPIDVVKVRAKPDHLPESFEISVESLVDFDGVIHVRDLAIPPDVQMLTDLDEVVARVLPPRIEVEEVKVEEEAVEEAAAGEAAPAAPERETAEGPVPA